MKSRRVYMVMGHNNKTRNTYVSAVFSNKKKAEEHMIFIDKCVKNHAPEDDRHYWVMSEKVQ